MQGGRYRGHRRRGDGESAVARAKSETKRKQPMRVGRDFGCGNGRGGDVTVLGYMGEMEGFGVTVFRAVAEAGEKISSSKVRAALKERRPEEAARLLGHWWSIEAHVASGDRRGRALGFPTANLKLEHTLQPAFGI